MGHWWTGNKGKSKCPDKTLSKCHFVHYRSHIYRSGIVPSLCGETLVN